MPFASVNGTALVKVHWSGPPVGFLEAIPEVERMYGDIYHFVASWLPDYARDSRNYLTVAIGCTGGQHRSVYLAERLAQAFSPRYQVLVRHRQIASAPA